MKNNHKPLSYNESGVDIEAGEAFVEDIAKYAKTTERLGSMGGFGGFGGLFDIGRLGLNSPILVLLHWTQLQGSVLGVACFYEATG